MNKKYRFFINNAVVMAVLAIASFLYPFYKLVVIYRSGIHDAATIAASIRTVMFGCWFVTLLCGGFAYMYVFLAYKARSVKEDENEL